MPASRPKILQIPPHLANPQEQGTLVEKEGDEGSGVSRGKDGGDGSNEAPSEDAAYLARILYNIYKREYFSDIPPQFAWERLNCEEGQRYFTELLGDLKPESYSPRQAREVFLAAKKAFLANWQWGKTGKGVPGLAPLASGAALYEEDKRKDQEEYIRQLKALHASMAYAVKQAAKQIRPSWMTAQLPGETKKGVLGWWSGLDPEEAIEAAEKEKEENERKAAIAAATAAESGGAAQATTAQPPQQDEQSVTPPKESQEQQKQEHKKSLSLATTATTATKPSPQDATVAAKPPERRGSVNGPGQGGASVAPSHGQQPSGGTVPFTGQHHSRVSSVPSVGSQNLLGGQAIPHHRHATGSLTNIAQLFGVPSQQPLGVLPTHSRIGSQQSVGMILGATPGHSRGPSLQAQPMVMVPTHSRVSSLQSGAVQVAGHLRAPSQPSVAMTAGVPPPPQSRRGSLQSSVVMPPGSIPTHMRGPSQASVAMTAAMPPPPQSRRGSLQSSVIMPPGSVMMAPESVPTHSRLTTQQSMGGMASIAGSSHFRGPSQASVITMSQVPGPEMLRRGSQQSIAMVPNPGPPPPSHSRVNTMQSMAMASVQGSSHIRMPSQQSVAAMSQASRPVLQRAPSQMSMVSGPVLQRAPSQMSVGPTPSLMRLPSQQSIAMTQSQAPSMLPTHSRMPSQMSMASIPVNIPPVLMRAPSQQSVVMPPPAPLPTHSRAPSQLSMAAMSIQAPPTIIGAPSQQSVAMSASASQAPPPTHQRNPSQQSVSVAKAPVPTLSRAPSSVSAAPSFRPPYFAQPSMRSVRRSSITSHMKRISEGSLQDTLSSGTRGRVPPPEPSIAQTYTQQPIAATATTFSAPTPPPVSQPQYHSRAPSVSSQSMQRTAQMPPPPPQMDNTMAIPQSSAINQATAAARSTTGLHSRQVTMGSVAMGSVAQPNVPMINTQSSIRPQALGSSGASVVNRTGPASIAPSARPPPITTSSLAPSQRFDQQQQRAYDMPTTPMSDISGSGQGQIAATSERRQMSMSNISGPQQQPPPPIPTTTESYYPQDDHHTVVTSRPPQVPPSSRSQQGPPAESRMTGGAGGGTPHSVANMSTRRPASSRRPSTTTPPEQPKAYFNTTPTHIPEDIGGSVRGGGGGGGRGGGAGVSAEPMRTTTMRETGEVENGGGRGPITSMRHGSRDSFDGGRDSPLSLSRSQGSAHQEYQQGGGAPAMVSTRQGRTTGNLSPRSAHSTSQPLPPQPQQAQPEVQPAATLSHSRRPSRPSSEDGGGSLRKTGFVTSPAPQQQPFSGQPDQTPPVAQPTATLSHSRRPSRLSSEDGGGSLRKTGFGISSIPQEQQQPEQVTTGGRFPQDERPSQPQHLTGAPEGEGRPFGGSGPQATRALSQRSLSHRGSRASWDGSDDFLQPTPEGPLESAGLGRSHGQPTRQSGGQDVTGAMAQSGPGRSEAFKGGKTYSGPPVTTPPGQQPRFAQTTPANYMQPGGQAATATQPRDSGIMSPLSMGASQPAFNEQQQGPQVEQGYGDVYAASTPQSNTQLQQYQQQQLLQQSQPQPTAMHPRMLQTRTAGPAMEGVAPPAHPQYQQHPATTTISQPQQYTQEYHPVMTQGGALQMQDAYTFDMDPLQQVHQAAYAPQTTQHQGPSYQCDGGVTTQPPHMQAQIQQHEAMYEPAMAYEASAPQGGYYASQQTQGMPHYPQHQMSPTSGLADHVFSYQEQGLPYQHEAMGVAPVYDNQQAEYWPDPQGEQALGPPVATHQDHVPRESPRKTHRRRFTWPSLEADRAYGDGIGIDPQEWLKELQRYEDEVAYQQQEYENEYQPYQEEGQYLEGHAVDHMAAGWQGQVEDHQPYVTMEQPGEVEVNDGYLQYNNGYGMEGLDYGEVEQGYGAQMPYMDDGQYQGQYESYGGQWDGYQQGVYEPQWDQEQLQQVPVGYGQTPEVVEYDDQWRGEGDEMVMYQGQQPPVSGINDQWVAEDQYVEPQVQGQGLASPPPDYEDQWEEEEVEREDMGRGPSPPPAYTGQGEQQDARTSGSRQVTVQNEEISSGGRLRRQDTTASRRAGGISPPREDQNVAGGGGVPSSRRGSRVGQSNGDTRSRSRSPVLDNQSVQQPSRSSPEPPVTDISPGRRSPANSTPGRNRSPQALSPIRESQASSATGLGSPTKSGGQLDATLPLMEDDEEGGMGHSGWIVRLSGPDLEARWLARVPKGDYQRLGASPGKKRVFGKGDEGEEKKEEAEAMMAPPTPRPGSGRGGLEEDHRQLESELAHIEQMIHLVSEGFEVQNKTGVEEDKATRLSPSLVDVDGNIEIIRQTIQSMVVVAGGEVEGVSNA